MCGLSVVIHIDPYDSSVLTLRAVHLISHGLGRGRPICLLVEWTIHRLVLVVGLTRGPVLHDFLS